MDVAAQVDMVAVVVETVVDDAVVAAAVVDSQLQLHDFDYSFQVWDHDVLLESRHSQILKCQYDQCCCMFSLTE